MKTKLPLVTLITLILLIIGGVAHLAFRKTDADYVKILNDAQKQYTELHKNGNDDWFITNTPQPGFYEMAGDVAWKYGEKLKSNLRQYKGVNQTTSEIWNTFENFITTVQINKGAPYEHLQTVATPPAGFVPQKGHEVALLPRNLAVEHLQHNSLGILLAWRVEDECISLASIDWPEKFLAGVLYHEFYHAKISLASQGSRFRIYNERVMALEEMRAHTIEADILNTATGGAYYRLFEEIENRAWSTGNLKSLVSHMTLDDMRKLDKMLEVDKTSPMVAMFSYSQYIIGLATHSMSKRNSSDAEKTDFFLWLKKSGVM